jgi:hypothetical protein
VTEFEVSGPIIHLIAQRSSVNPILLAVGFLRGFEVIAFQNKSHRRLIHHTVRNGEQHLLNLQWVSGHLAVLWPNSVEIFSIEERPEPATPIETYTISGEIMTSFVFYDHEGLTVVLVAFMSGKSALEPILVGAGPTIRLSATSRWPSKFTGLTISACPEANLCFLAAVGVDLQLYRMDSIFGGSTTKAHIGFDGASHSPVTFCTTVPGCQSMLIFRQTVTNTLHICEFTDTTIISSKLSVKQRCRFFDRDQDIYAWAVTDDNFFVIASDGSVQRLVSEQEVVADSEEYRVPLTFWSLASIATTDNSEITGTDTSQDYNSLYNDNTAYFHSNVVDKVLSFHLRDPSYAIVGILLGFVRNQSEARPPYVVLKGRRYSTKGDHNHLFPLMPSEVRPGEKVDLLFPAPTTCDIAMQSAVIFIMKVNHIKPFLNPDPQIKNWLSDPTDLFDFTDVIPKDAPLIQRTAHQLATTIFVQDGQEIDQTLVRRLIRCLYSSPQISIAARSALIRIAAIRPGLVQDWAEGLAEVLRAGEVSPELWDYVWRDFAVLPRNVQLGLQNVIWDAAPKVGCLASVLSAFSFHSE